jgi:hypothetical protein
VRQILAELSGEKTLSSLTQVAVSS